MALHLSLIFGMAMGSLLSGFPGPAATGQENPLGQVVRIEEHPYSFRGLPLAYTVGIPQGEGLAGVPIVVFLEGDGTLCESYSQDRWRQFVAQFTGRYLLVRPKTYLSSVCRGFLFPGAEFRKADFLHRLDDLDALATSVTSRFPGRRLVLAGHSAGADLAILFASRYPGRVAGLVNLAGGLRPLGDLLPEIEKAKAARKGWSRRRLEERLRDVAQTLEKVRAHPTSEEPFWGRTYRFWHQLFFSGIRDLWLSYDQPVLVLQGMRDVSGTPADTVLADRKALAGTHRNLDFRFYPELGHDLYTPGVFRDIDDWLSHLH